MFGGMADLRNQAGFHAIEHACRDGPCGLPDNHENRGCDEQSDDGVGERKTKPDAQCATHNGETGQAIRPRVIAVGNQPECGNGDSLIADKANDASISTHVSDVMVWDGRCDQSPRNRQRWR